MIKRFICCNSVSADLGLYELDTRYWTVREILRQPIDGVEGKSAAMPAAILSDRLYLGWRGNEPAILTLKIEPGERGFSTLGSLSVPESCCYLTISPEQKFLLAAGGENGLVIDLDEDGCAKSVVSRVAVGSMAHCLISDGTHAYGAACRDDLLRKFSFDAGNGALKPLTVAHFPPNSGPRHILLDKMREQILVITQESGTITILSNAESNAKFGICSTTPLVNISKPLAADITMSRNGRFLFALERATQSVISLAMNEAGAAPRILDRADAPSNARMLHLSQNDDYLITVGFRDHIGRIYAIGADGSLSPKVDFPTGARPSWILGIPDG
nr:beta-propeller fold lactonase family protein [uncultured Cohaesibacter sp.]